MLRALFDEVLQDCDAARLRARFVSRLSDRGPVLYAAGARHARVMLTLHDEGGATLLDAVRIAVGGLHARAQQRHPSPARTAMLAALDGRVSRWLCQPGRCPSLHRPKPVRSPENRWPKVWRFAFVLLPAGEPLPVPGDGIPILHVCSLSRRPSCRIMQVPQPSSFFNLHVDGIGYLNRVRTVKRRMARSSWPVTVAALRGQRPGRQLHEVRLPCQRCGSRRQSCGAWRGDVAAERTVIIGFRIAGLLSGALHLGEG